ncbi:hypothetical protein ACFVUH_18285 [Kitasatospora sp. NPDC058032]|uniref:hypothetical protein n=1 Tax=Kitasatospora sp. NPDC058032 TaxID=3346307 RepID=UPI0036D7F59F
MTTIAEPTIADSTQVTAAGALLAVLSAHADLPAPDAGLRQFFEPDTEIPWGAWGVRLSLHRGLGAFEQWREALDLDPSAIDSVECGTTGWLTAHGTSHGVPIEVNGFYSLPGAFAA